MGRYSEGRALIQGNAILKWLLDAYPQYVLNEETELRVHSANIIENEKMKDRIANWRLHRETILETRNKPHP